MNNQQLKPELKGEGITAAECITRWRGAAALVGPFTPTGIGGNDGWVRDAAGVAVCDTNGCEARADVIAAALNIVLASCAICGGTGWYMRELPGKRHPNQCTACNRSPSSVVLAFDTSWSTPPAPAVAEGGEK